MKQEIIKLGPFPPQTPETLTAHFRVHELWRAADRQALLAELGPRIRAIAAVGSDPVDGPFMDQLPGLEIVSCFGVGIDGIDLDAARERGIAVTNTPEVLNECVADLGMALILACLRRVAVGDRFVRAGDWERRSFSLGHALGGRRLGIVGLGRIGLALAKRAQAFGMTIAYHNRHRRADVDFDYHDDPAALAGAADVLALTCPGGAATRHLVDETVLRALGPDGWLVNVARGSVVDETALVQALEGGVIAGAGLDVFEDEPRMPAALFAMDNVVLQPHHASGTVETRLAMAEIVADNLLAHFAGKPLLTPVT